MALRFELYTSIIIIPSIKITGTASNVIEYQPLGILLRLQNLLNLHQPLCRELAHRIVIMSEWYSGVYAGSRVIDDGAEFANIDLMGDGH